ncbi:MAG: N-6 DNA methylase, partial [Patescibacteria group bacterium]|nr:N-6 DNA methylase [Patescibacteria group bacterium]
FLTPTSIVKLIVEIIEPFHGRILDPACGSGGMFVQSAEFVERHKKDAMAEIAICGQEISSENVNIAKMNLAVHGLAGDIKQGNSYYDDIHHSFGQFDFVMANPPFNSKGIDKKKISDDPRFAFGLPKNDNGNYIWIQIFYSALNNTGRAGFVMANSASDAGNTEKDIRQKLIKEGVVDVILAVDSNFFHTVTLPCTLWFLDKAKPKMYRKDKILFLDARGYYEQIDRAHREFKPEQIQFFGDIVRLYRGEKPEFPENKLLSEKFPGLKYQDIKGLCKLVDIKDIKEQDFSLNPGRYVGIKPLPPMPKKDFIAKMDSLSQEFAKLTIQSHELEKSINENIKKIFNKK